VVDSGLGPIRKEKKLRSLNNEKGVIFMEMCIVLPVLLVLLVFIANVGMGFREWNLISFAAREGARYGAQTSSTYDATARAESLIKSNKDMSQNAPLGNKYLISSQIDSGLMYVTINWKGGGMNIESEKCFRLAI
jgi:Flp pilus assembly protein TadG